MGCSCKKLSNNINVKNLSSESQVRIFINFDYIYRIQQRL